MHATGDIPIPHIHPHKAAYRNAGRGWMRGEGAAVCMIVGLGRGCCMYMTSATGHTYTPMSHRL
eukprot:362350-Chlamydomonas_euryale.AAC.3